MLKTHHILLLSYILVMNTTSSTVLSRSIRSHNVSCKQCITLANQAVNSKNVVITCFIGKDSSHHRHLSLHMFIYYIMLNQTKQY